MSSQRSHRSYSPNTYPEGFERKIPLFALTSSIMNYVHLCGVYGHPALAS